MRQKAVWSLAARRRAAKFGRISGPLGSRAAKAKAGRLGGLLAWHLKTPEQQEATVAMLREARQRNKTRRAKRAQAKRAYAQGKARTSMTQGQAEFLADIGTLKRRPLTGCPVLPILGE